MKMDKKNIAVVVVLVALGILFLLIIYAVNSGNKKEEKVIKEEEPKVNEKEQLLNDPDVQTLLSVFSKLDTDRDSVYLTREFNAKEYYEERDLTNEEKLFVVFKTIPARDYSNIDCNNLSFAFNVPDGLVCTKRSYGINRGIIMARYSELFGYEKEIELNDFLTYIYDPETYTYIYFELEKDVTEYDMPKAVIKEAYMEDGLLVIKYRLDYSQVNSGYYNEEITLKFKKSGENYIFVSRKMDVYS